PRLRRQLHRDQDRLLRDAQRLVQEDQPRQRLRRPLTPQRQCPMRILIAYDSLSGNTRDLARMVRGCCEARGHAVTWPAPASPAPADARPLPRHAVSLLGAWTATAGRTPAALKRSLAALVEAVGKPERLAVFGTGETQWGE